MSEELGEETLVITLWCVISRTLLTLRSDLIQDNISLSYLYIEERAVTASFLPTRHIYCLFLLMVYSLFNLHQREKLLWVEQFFRNLGRYFVRAN